MTILTILLKVCQMPPQMDRDIQWKTGRNNIRK